MPFAAWNGPSPGGAGNYHSLFPIYSSGPAGADIFAMAWVDPTILVYNSDGTPHPPVVSDNTYSFTVIYQTEN